MASPVVRRWAVVAKRFYPYLVSQPEPIFESVRLSDNDERTREIIESLPRHFDPETLAVVDLILRSEWADEKFNEISQERAGFMTRLLKFGKRKN